jgi:5-methyltetrahydrofolate--homocysteine methyltransferase
MCQVIYGEEILLIIGERINSSIKNIEKAIINRDTKHIQKEVTAQIQAGSHVIDLNAGTILKAEPEALKWLIKTVMDSESYSNQIQIALDSSNPEAIRVGLEEIDKAQLTKNTIINSVTAEGSNLDNILPLTKEFGSKLIGLCMNDHGIPDQPSDRFKLGLQILQIADEYHIKHSDIYLDPLVLPVSTDINNGVKVLDTIRLLKSEDSNILTVIGLSNISYGLPIKELLNRTYLSMVLAVGLDAAILNPLDKKLMSSIKAAETLMAKDDYCMKYISAYRNNELEL